MKQHERLVQKTIALQREITREGLTRRDLLKMGLLGGSGMLLPIPGLSLRAAWGDGSCPVPGKDIVSPFTKPWQDPMPRLIEKQTVPGNTPAAVTPATEPPDPDIFFAGNSKSRLRQDFPALFAGWNLGAGGATPFAFKHQAWIGPASVGKDPRLNFPPQDWYEFSVQQFTHHWHKDLNPVTGNPAWGFDSVYPGPMLRTFYGRPHFVRIHNRLPPTPPPGQRAESPLGFGINQISTHLHNMHSPSESDGNPLYTNTQGNYWDYHYPNAYAGILQFRGLGIPGVSRDDLGNPNEALGTMWYHDHKLDFTSQNVYAGLAGMTSIYDAPGIYTDPAMGDYGDETLGWRLPCGPRDAEIPYEFDVGLVFHDRQFDRDGRDFFPLTCLDGALGDKLTVNGRIQPFFEVKRRRYRLRTLNLGPSRFYWWFLRTNGKFVPFLAVANDGDLLPYPVSTLSFKQSVAERLDIVIDFSAYPLGTELILVNRAEQENGRGPTGNLLSPGMEALKFIVTGDARDDSAELIAINDPQKRPPTPLRPLPDRLADLQNAKVTRRSWRFDRGGGEWTVNGNPFDRQVINASIPEGSGERWTVANNGGSWSHPMHPHYEQHRLLRVNGAAQPDPTAPLEVGRKDTLRLDPNAQAEIFMRFRDYRGQYVMHCHNVVHEDHAMMINWKIVDADHP